MLQIITFYRFIPLSDLNTIREELKAAMKLHAIMGTIILAEEGFNSTVGGQPKQLEQFVKKAEEILGCFIEFKSSYHNATPFRKIDVKIKPEIVTLKRAVDIDLGKGTHVDPTEWNALISDPATIVLDARNEYEVKNGSFKNAVDPRTEKFSDLPQFIEEHLQNSKDRKIAMYCTGGIRCEKFVPYLISQGFENVFQLHGGILKYLEDVEPDASLWVGECFVFDDRRTVNERLEKGVQKDYSHPDNRSGEDE